MIDQSILKKKQASRSWPMLRSSRPAPVAFLQSRILAVTVLQYSTSKIDARETGNMKKCWYNELKLYGCSGVLNALENDCGCRKSSHFNWYIKTGQVKYIISEQAVGMIKKILKTEL